MNNLLSFSTDDAPVNYTKEAFLNPWNLTFLVTIMLTAFFLSDQNWLQEIILLFGLAAELLFLGIVPRSERFQRYVRSRQMEEENRPPSRDEIFRRLSKQKQKQFIHLRNLEKKIRSNYRQIDYTAQGMVENHLRKIDNLLQSYLDMLHLRERYERFTSHRAQQEVKQSISALEDELENASERVRSVKERRLTILEKRLERYHQAGENVEVLDAQIETIEDAVQYIHEQSITMNNPEAVTLELDTLLTDVEETQRSVDELNELFGRGAGGIFEDVEPIESETSETTRPSDQRLRS
jgi:hypothetical protein